MAEPEKPWLESVRPPGALEDNALGWTYRGWARVVAAGHLPRSTLDPVFRLDPQHLPCGFHGVPGTAQEAREDKLGVREWETAKKQFQSAVMTAIESLVAGVKRDKSPAGVRPLSISPPVRPLASARRRCDGAEPRRSLMRPQVPPHLGLPPSSAGRTYAPDFAPTTHTRTAANPGVRACVHRNERLVFFLSVFSVLCCCSVYCVAGGGRTAA